MPRFTTTWLNSLQRKQPPKRKDYTDVGRKGFMLRHWPGGELTFVVRFQRDGKPYIMTLGNYPTLSLEEAHEQHADIRKELAQGLDPIAERDRRSREREIESQKRKIADAITIRNVIAEWAWHYARRHRKHPIEAIRLLKKYLGEPLAGKPAHEISKRDLVIAIDKILARGSNVMANRLRDLTCQVFAFAAERDLIENSPAAGLRKKPGGQEKSKERALSSEEIRAMWHALDDGKTKMSAPIRLALKLILATAQRPGEIAGAKFSEFDVDQKIWTIPSKRSKNGREHYVPLGDIAVELLHRLKSLARGSAYILPSAHHKEKPGERVSERALSRALKRNHKISGDKSTLFGTIPFTPHDLRRTAGTRMTAIGVPRLHVKKLLNHSDDETTAIYDRHHYWQEKQDAVAKWMAELNRIIDAPASARH
jgi:integrase